MLRSTVSGSFHKHVTAIEKAVEELTSLGVKVLSPWKGILYPSLIYHCVFNEEAGSGGRACNSPN